MEENSTFDAITYENLKAIIDNWLSGRYQQGVSVQSDDFLAKWTQKWV